MQIFSNKTFFESLFVIKQKFDQSG